MPNQDLGKDLVQEKLMQASHKMAEEMYKTAQKSGEGATAAGPEASTGEEPKKKEEEAVEAEFTEAKE